MLNHVVNVYLKYLIVQFSVIVFTTIGWTNKYSWLLNDAIETASECSDFHKRQSIAKPLLMPTARG